MSVITQRWIYTSKEKILFLGDATSEDFFNNDYMGKNKLNMLIAEIEETDCEYCVLSHVEPLAQQDLLDYLHNVNANGENL